ncbi:MAG: type IV pilus assembly protein PilM [bacterium]|nr:type IV pilus assembly protein PilM [bacterium]
MLHYSMKLGSFRFLPKSALGVDIGTSTIKVVELSRWGVRKSLKNYGEIRASVLYEKPFRTAEKSSLLLSSKDIARALRAILEEAKIESKKAVFSIPDFSSFFTHFELPPMTKDELPEAVQFEARKHIPLPFSEVTFDWQVLNAKRFAVGQQEPYKILMVAVPNELINQYQEIASLAKLELVALEAEVFGLLRSSLKDEKESLVVLDIGAQTTTINVVAGGILQTSYSIDIGGGSFSERISQSLSIAREQAEAKKKQEGLSSPDIRKVLSPLLDTIITEMNRVTAQFQGEGAAKIVLGGGSALLLGLAGYMKENTKKEVEMMDPFHSLFYPPVLEDTIKEMGPSYSVAVGMALRGLQ